MAKIHGIVLEKVTHENTLEEVLRLTRPVEIRPEEGDRQEDIVKAFQDALSHILPFIPNGRRDQDGFASATILISPLKEGKAKRELAQTIAKRVLIGSLIEWHKYQIKVDTKMPSVIKIIIITPFPNYPTWPFKNFDVKIFDEACDLGI